VRGIAVSFVAPLADPLAHRWPGLNVQNPAELRLPAQFGIDFQAGKPLKPAGADNQQ
jgi:hypothetical protein